MSRTRSAYLDADGEPGTEPLRLAGDTLLWERAGTTLRVEGARDLAEALEIAALDGTLTAGRGVRTGVKRIASSLVCPSSC